METFNERDFLKMAHYYRNEPVPNDVGNRASKNCMLSIIKQCKFDVKDVLSYLDQLIEEHVPEYKGKFISKRGWDKVYDVYAKSNTYPQLNKMLGNSNPATADEYDTCFRVSAIECGLDPDTLITELFIDTIGWDRMIDTLVKMYESGTEDKSKEESKTETAVDTEKDSVSPRETAKAESEEEKEVKTPTEPKEEKKENTESAPKTAVEPTTTKRGRGGKKDPILRYKLDKTFDQKFDSVSRAAESVGMKHSNFIPAYSNTNIIKDYLWVKISELTDHSVIPETFPVEIRHKERKSPARKKGVGKDCEKTCEMETASIPTDETGVVASKDGVSSYVAEDGKGVDDTCSTETTSVPTDPTTDVCDGVSTDETSSSETFNPTEIGEGRKLCAYFYNKDKADGKGQLYKTYRTQKEAAEDLGKPESSISKSVNKLIDYVRTSIGKLYFKWEGEENDKDVEKKQTGKRGFFPYPGGKQREFHHFAEFIPKNIDRYIEPCLGGGSVFLSVNDAKEYLVNDIAKDITSTISYIQQNDEDFCKSLNDIILSWDNAKIFCEKYGGEIYEIYEQLYVEDINAEIMKSMVVDFCNEHHTQINNINGELNRYPCVLTSRIAEDIYNGMITMKDKDIANPDDFLTYLEAEVKNSLFENHISLYNNRDVAENNPRLHSALYVFSRHYSYYGKFAYDDEGNFISNFEMGNRKDGRVKYSLRDKLKYYASDCVVDHLNKTKIHNSDFEYFLKGVEPQENDFMFLDPPYFETFSEYNNSEFVEQDHRRLAHYLIDECKGKWMMVIKDCDLIRELYTQPGIHFLTSYEVSYKMDNDKKEKVTHLVITNYTLDEVQSASVKNVSVENVSTESPTMAA